MVDIIDKFQKIAEIGMSPEEKQGLINVSEVFYVWDILVTKLDILDNIHLIMNYIEDKDLDFIAHQLIDGLQSGINEMEKLMKDYGLPFPTQPPVDSNISCDIEAITDRYIFQTIFEGIQCFFPLLSSGFMNCTSAKIRKAFKKHLLLSMELQELIVDYGKLKGFLYEPPIYRT
jgi:hypothetical protein